MGDEPVRCARSAASPRSPWTAITAPGRSRCSGSPVTPRSKRYVNLTVSLGSCRPARYMRTGSRARRSQACCPWPGSSTGTTGSRSTVNQVCPASLPPAMRGLVPIRRRAGGLRPGWCTPHCCAVSSALTSTILLNWRRCGTSTPNNASHPSAGTKLLPTAPMRIPGPDRHQLLRLLSG
jgi:hypothetical protein